MVQAFLPKIHRTRRKILRQLARQRHIMSQTEEFGQPLGEYPSSSSSLPSGGGGGIGGGEGLFLEKPPCSSGDMYCVADECPADMTCPAGGMARDFSEKPGPMPGIRPPMGGAGGMVPPPQGKGSGAMGIIMPLYTVGIVVFFVYTIMKVLFKKGPDDDKTPKLKDFGLDPEYRKYVFAEEYLDNAEISTRDQMRRQAREESRSRKKVQQDQVPDTKIGQRRLPSEGGLDTQGKKLGEWYLPEGFLDIVDEDSEYEDTIGGTTINECIHETIRSRLQDGICANKKDSHLRKRQTFPKHGHQNLYGDDDYRSLGAQNSSREFSESLRSMTHSKENPLPENFELEDDYLADESFSCSNDFLKLIEEKLTNCDEGSDYENFKELFLMAQEHIKIKQQIYDEETGEHFDTEHTENSEDEEDSPPEFTGKTDEECHIDQYATNCDSSQPQEYEDGSQEERTDTYQDEHDYASNQGKSECDKKDEQLDHLRRRLEETEKAMERLMCQMGSVTDKLMTAKITEVLSQAQAQAKILKEEVGDITSEEELTSSEALTTTMSEDNSLPTSLQQHLHALQNEDSPISSKGSSPDMEEYEVINKDEDTAHKLRTQRETSSGEPVIDKVKAAESTEVSSQAAQLHTGEEAPSEKENESQKEEKVVKGKERSRSKEPEEKKSSDKANVCEDQGKDSPSCPVDDSSSAKATDPEATLCTPSDSLGAEEGQTDIDSSTSKENVSSDNADSE